MKPYDPDKAASLIRAVMALKKLTQKELADKIGISRQWLNYYLCRQIDLLPKHIDAIVRELGLEKQAEKLTGMNNET